jgi:adenosylcobinamide-GDP ribazoletransferase
MKDPNVGAMGVITVTLCLLLKFSGITGIKGDNAWIWLLTAPALARASQVIGLVFMDNARGDGGIGAHFFQKHNYQALIFCFIPLIVPFIINIKAGLFISISFAISTITALLYFQSRIGGMTGDTLGATTEIVETAILVSGGLACTSITSL